MNNYLEISLEYSLQKLLNNPSGILLLQKLNENKIRKLTEFIVNNNIFNDNKLLNTAIENIWPKGSVKQFVSHIIWCAHRDACYVKPFVQEDFEMTLNVKGTEHLTSIKDKPVIVICPMTMPTGDALKFVTKLSQKYLNDKEVVVYGENMSPYLKRNPHLKSYFAEENLSGIKKIKRVLKNNGCFFTYADFVYDSHAAMTGTIFGIKRPFSQGLISIALSSKSILMPMLFLRKGKQIDLSVHQPVMQNTFERDAALPHKIKEQILCVVIAKILEGLIVKATNQWRLLPTLTHEVVYN